VNISYHSPKRLNDIQYVNKHLEIVNVWHKEGDVIEVFFESKNQRKKRLLNKWIWPINYVYYILDFVLKRLFPKWSPTLKIYFWITKGRNRVFSLPEIMGRVCSCGFEIVRYYEKEEHTFIQARKIGNPAYNTNPTYGLLIKLIRIGKAKRKFVVYKFRTMHPFAEYIQAYMFDNNNLKDGGKIDNDFRVTSYGKIMRKLWLDELPMIWNMLRGDMKLVGVRPLSEHFFGLYPEDMQELRTQTKPGLVPPFYADLPVTLDEVIASERKYLEAYLKRPIATDWKYFWAAFYNIVVKRARSN
jgi:hypothetical protein